MLHLYLSESLCLWWARSVPGAWIASLANFTALAIDKMGSKSVSSYFKYLQALFLSVAVVCKKNITSKLLVLFLTSTTQKQLC